MSYDILGAFMKTFIITTLVIFFSTLIFKLNKKNEDKKVSNLQERFKHFGWSSPVFNNLGFFLGIFMLCFGLWAVYPLIKTGQMGIDFSTIVATAILLLGLSFLWITPFIKINSDLIVVTPLLLKLLGLNIVKTRIMLENISEATKVDSLYTYLYPIVASIQIRTKDGKSVVIHTEFFNSEVSGALLEYLGGKNQISR